MYKTGLTRSLYNHFRTSYQSFNPKENSPAKAYVYVDAEGFKLLTDVDFKDDEGGIFALATTEDGIIEALSFR